MAEVKMRTLLLATGGTALLVALIVAGTLVFALGIGSSEGEGAPADGQAAEGGTDAGEAQEEQGPPLYKKIEPAILVNFESDSGPDYLQVKIELMARSQDVLDRVETHMPAIRNDLILLLSQQDPTTLRTHEGKTELRQEILQAVRSVISVDGSGNAPNVEAVYFTNFVMQ